MTIARLLALLIFLTLNRVNADQALIQPEAASGLTAKPGWSTEHFAVAAANPLAVEAGYQILKAGGTALDAAIAVQMVLTLVEPQSSGIGGGGFLMHWDGIAMRKKFPAWMEATLTARGWATNHLCGLGWWVWIIPLKGGDVSIGIVYDTRLFSPPEGASIGERILTHCRTHPVGREMLANARAIEGDQRAFSQLPYRVTQTAGDGWACVGDAAGFLDPFYSPGLDFCSFTAQGVATLVLSALAGEKPDPAEYHRRFAFCFRSWFECIYRDKYYYLGDSEIMAAAFLMDIATYHLGPVAQVYKDPSTMFASFPFDGRPGRIAASLISFYNRRLARLAKKKIAAGKYGERNAGWRLLVGGFTPDHDVSGRLLFKGIWLWLKMELAALFWRK